MENSLAVPYMIEYRAPVWPRNSTLKYVPKRNKNICPHKNPYTYFHSSKKFIIAKKWEEPKCNIIKEGSKQANKEAWRKKGKKKRKKNPNAHQGIPWWVKQNVVYLHYGVHSAHATTWTNLEDKMWSERSKTQRTTCCIISFIWSVQSRQIRRKRKQSSSCLGLGRRVTLHGILGFFSGMMKIF